MLTFFCHCLPLSFALFFAFCLLFPYIVLLSCSFLLVVLFVCDADLLFFLQSALLGLGSACSASQEGRCAGMKTTPTTQPSSSTSSFSFWLLHHPRPFLPSSSGSSLLKASLRIRFCLFSASHPIMSMLYSPSTPDCWRQQGNIIHWQLL